MSVAEIVAVIKAFFDALVNIINVIKSGFKSDEEGEAADGDA